MVAMTDPGWELAKAARRRMGFDDAVEAVNRLQKQYRLQWSNRMAKSSIDLFTILQTLAAKKIPILLTGAHGIAAWTGRPRNTQDVDLLVKSGRNYSRAVNAIRQLYPELEVRGIACVTGFFHPGEKDSVIDVMYAHRRDLEETLAHPVWAMHAESRLRYRIPSLEAALANKYGAMLTISRDSRKRRQDILDFEWMVLHSLDEGQPAIDLQKVESLGECVWPGGGGKEILRLIDQVKAGQAIALESLGPRSN